MAKNLFNFYVEDDDKKEAICKLARLGAGGNKGALSSALRVMIKKFVDTPDNEVDKELLTAIDKEYEYSEKKNKRSRL